MRDPTTPTKGGTYTSDPCDATGKGVDRCGSTLRVWLAPEGLPDRPGWWHARCVRCDARFLWRPPAPLSMAPSFAGIDEIAEDMRRDQERPNAAAGLRAALARLDEAAAVPVSLGATAGILPRVECGSMVPARDRAPALAYLDAVEAVTARARDLLDVVDAHGRVPSSGALAPAAEPPAEDPAERARLVAVLNGYTVLYPHSPSVADAEREGVGLTNAEALRRCTAAARRILDELADDGISVGAEEDAEAAIVVVREMADGLNRAMDVHERPSLEVLRFAVLLTRATVEIIDEGITAETARALADLDRPAADRVAPSPATETWSVSVGGDLVALLDELAEVRNGASPDAFGPLGHRPGIIAEAVALGLRELIRTSKPT